MNTAVRAITRGQPVGLDCESRDLSLDDSNAARFKFGAFRRRQVVGVHEEDDVVRPLPHQLCVQHGTRLSAEYREGLLAYLPPVAVRAVQEVATPPFADPGDVRQLVADTSRNQESPSRQHPAVGETNDEPGLDPQDVILDQLHAVAGDLGTCRGQEVGRRHPVPRQETLHVGGGSVARRSRIDHGDPPARPAQHESRARAGRSATDHHDVIVLIFLMLVCIHSDHLQCRARWNRKSGHGLSPGVDERPPCADKHHHPGTR
jgi:hypothetical protein